MQRKVLEVQINRLVEEGKNNEAKKLLDELQNLPTQDQLASLLSQQQNLVFDSNAQIQSKIDKMFGSTRQVIFKYIDAQLAGDLRKKLQEAQSGE
jgi:hypothetical protein